MIQLKIFGETIPTCFRDGRVSPCNGPITRFYDNGSPKFTLSFYNGKPHGFWLFFNRDNNIVFHLIFNRSYFMYYKVESGVNKKYYKVYYPEYEV